jgi:hypothetical protein
MYSVLWGGMDGRRRLWPGQDHDDQNCNSSRTSTQP